MTPNKSAFFALLLALLLSHLSPISAQLSSSNSTVHFSDDILGAIDLSAPLSDEDLLAIDDDVLSVRNTEPTAEASVDPTPPDPFQLRLLPFLVRLTPERNANRMKLNVRRLLRFRVRRRQRIWVRVEIIDVAPTGFPFDRYPRFLWPGRVGPNPPPSSGNNDTGSGDPNSGGGNGGGNDPDSSGGGDGNSGGGDNGSEGDEEKDDAGKGDVNNGDDGSDGGSTSGGNKDGGEVNNGNQGSGDKDGGDADDENDGDEEDSNKGDEGKTNDGEGSVKDGGEKGDRDGDSVTGDDGVKGGSEEDGEKGKGKDDGGTDKGQDDGERGPGNDGKASDDDKDDNGNGASGGDSGKGGGGGEGDDGKTDDEVDDDRDDGHGGLRATPDAYPFYSFRVPNSVRSNSRVCQAVVVHITSDKFLRRDAIRFAMRRVRRVRNYKKVYVLPPTRWMVRRSRTRFTVLVRYKFSYLKRFILPG